MNALLVGGWYFLLCYSQSFAFVILSFPLSLIAHLPFYLSAKDAQISSKTHSWIPVNQKIVYDEALKIKAHPQRS
jgi:hypothetical protein